MGGNEDRAYYVVRREKVNSVPQSTAVAQTQARVKGD